MKRNIFDLSGRNVVVTGATSGIGRSTCIAFAEAGANVFAVGRREEKLTALTERLREENVTADYMVCDVADKAQTVKAIEKAEMLFRQVHVLVNAAGTTGETTVGQLDCDEWEREFSVNLMGTVNMCDAVLKNMQKYKYGRIVNVASVNAFAASQTVARHAYNSSKSAVCGLTIGMAATYMKDNITVNTVCPGLFETEMTKHLFENKIVISTYNRQVPAGRPGKPDEMNGAILFLSGDASSYITGQCIAVDGGFLNASYL